MSRKTTEELLEEPTDSETEIEHDDDDDDDDGDDGDDGDDDDDEVVSEPEDQCIMRDKVDEDEVESSSEDDPDNLSEIEISDKYFTSTGRVYVSKPPRISRRAAQNIVKEREGLRSEGKVATIIESFEKFFTPEIVDSIIKYSNEEAIRQKVPGTSRLGFLAYRGLLIFMGKESDSKTAVTDLWSNISGRFVYTATMSRTRFQQLTKIIRFDDKTTRNERREFDKFAAMREVFDKMNSVLPKCYSAGMHTVVDEMLSLFRGRCPFKVFMKDKPGNHDPDTGSVPITILSYIPCEKPKRNLFMLSTPHYDDAIGAPSDPKKKTVINLYYNDTKGGVDTVDLMVCKYSTKKSYQKMASVYFLHTYDIAALNGYTTFILNFPDWNKKKPNQRRLCLQELGLKLITPYIEERARNVTGLQKCVISAMEGILKRKIKQTSGAKRSSWW
ncbi:hypothetical protein ANN_21187 [Periplaneta americana]|uniref:PiggyBac transposable element-derived protein domain-containing protein n=1 Tax=Periplaneta americana TaxID=6978 RepID=A0ABQ8SEM7_PERAM|nr:hypothetical protein ANN_21187 [Periplaneta americana]